MYKLLTVFVTVGFVTTFVCNSALGFEVCDQNEEKPREPNVLVTAVAMGFEELGALGFGGIMGWATFKVTFDALGGGGGGVEDLGPGLVGLAAGYGLSFPLGSAIGASLVGLLADQRGSFRLSWAGAELGAITAVGLACILGNTRRGSFALQVLAAGPVVGAVMGYNLNKLTRAQQPDNSLDDSSGRDGPSLSLLVPEVELRRHRVSGSFREPAKDSSTLAYKLTLAKLSF